MLEEKVMEEGESELDMEEDIRILDNMEENWKGVVDYNKKDRSKVNSLRWDKYMKDKEEFIKKKLLAVVPHQKGGNIISIFLKI